MIRQLHLTHPEINDNEPPFPDVALPVENIKSPLTPLVPACSVLTTILPEVVSVLAPDEIVIDPPYPDPPVPPIKLPTPPSVLPEPDVNVNPPPVLVFDDPAVTDAEPP